MELDWGFPKRVTLCDDGAYRWTYDINAQRNRAGIRTMAGICAAIFVPIALIMAVMTWPYGPAQALTWTGALLALGVGLPALLWVLLPPNPSYRMNDVEIETWPKGKAWTIHEFKEFRRVTLRPDIDRIRLRRRVGVLDVYVPTEDYDLVKEFILAHVPEGTEIVSA